MHSSSTAIDFAGKTLAELAELTRRGETEAFRHIMQRCNQRLFRVARAVLTDDDEAQDALQDAYLNAFRHIDSFRGEAELTTWLTRIVLNECHRRLRSQRPTVDLEVLDGESGGAHVIAFPVRSGPDDPALCAARAQMRGLIEQAISTLPEPFRVVFVLRDIEECSIEETAAALGIRPETVKTRLFRARRQLRLALRDQLADASGEAFQFLGARCARLTDIVMQRLASDVQPRREN
ncbi:RNA polymerase sigma factor [Dokdonella sp.]|uniref:RNA polymerase sigma factor n=1 Tax=Dokdonella sp. TaxID=2291710 RepID=UPI0031CBC939|nr:RNA polymerase sigma factor [Dokdonella sp.]